ncbi:MAG: AMP-binding protein [Desulfobacterales bacterium]|jgi:acyl-CoA synthetase (AMP-forming)/AMP-acid ligase II
MRTIRYHIDKIALREPDKIFMIAPEPGLYLTYGQLQEDSVKLGKHLTKLGLQKGDKVSFMLGNGFQTTKIFLGAMYAGFVIAPLNLRVQPAQLEYVIDHSDTKLVFFTADQKDRLQKAIQNIKRIIPLIQIDNDAETIFPADEDFLESHLPQINEEDDALLIYTSGTTGDPKGVLLSHKNMVTGGQYTIAAHGLTAEDRALCSLPLYHINGQVVTVVAPLISAGSVVMPHKFSTANFWELISDYGCTWFSVVPTIISYLATATDLKGKNLNLDQLRFGRSASSALPPSLHKDFENKFKVSIVETMGLTETAAPVFSNPMDPAKRKYGSPGVAVGNQARIIDEQGNQLPRGIRGEIMIRGDNVMKAYYKAPDLTAKALDPNGWFHTGDLGYMDADGYIFVTGRIKELIIKGGENIAPKEIDEVLYRHPAVMEAAAVGIPDEHYGEEIMCCVVLKPDCTASEEELRCYCIEHLGEYKTPKKIEFMDELPKGPSGKIQRLKLSEFKGKDFKNDRMG